jgi:hypothetical protein
MLIRACIAIASPFDLRPSDLIERDLPVDWCENHRDTRARSRVILTYAAALTKSIVT